MKDLDRRRFLELAGAGVLLGACEGSGLGRRRAAVASDEPWTRAAAPAAFPYGVQAGDASTDAVILQTHYRGAGPLTLALRRVDDEAPAAEPDRSQPVPMPDPAAAGATRVVLGTLAAGATYRYVFDAPEGRSEAGVFRTALAPGAARRLRFGASSCTNAALYPWPTLARAAELELDFYLLLGDTTYCDGAVTLDEYRRKWQFTRESAEYRALFASCGVYATWDDHEVTNDWDPETVDPTQLAVALQAFEEHVPIGLRSPDGSVRIWRSQRWGDTLELFVLDCRSERRPSTAHTPAAQYVSRAQLDWLEQGLAASTARWKVIVNSVPIAHMPDYFQQEKDRWDKYEVQRDELLAFIADLGPEARVVWVAGDYHFAALMHIDRPGDPGAPVLPRREILTSPAGNAPNAYWPRVLTDDVVQFEWADGTPNVAVVTLDPDADEVLVEWHAGDGRVLASRRFAP